MRSFCFAAFRSSSAFCFRCASALLVLGAAEMPSFEEAEALRPLGCEEALRPLTEAVEPDEEGCCWSGAWNVRGTGFVDEESS